MKQTQNKAVYRRAGKRNVMKDISTPAGRQAKNRNAEKIAEQKLRKALDHPKDEKGKPVSGHLVTTLAANRLHAVSEHDCEWDFEITSGLFLEKLTYQPWGYATTVASLWDTFLQMVEKANIDSACDFAKFYRRDFKLYVIGHVQRLNLEYSRLPGALKTIEIYIQDNRETNFGVQNDGVRRFLPLDAPPEHPVFVRAGSRLALWLAPEDRRRLIQFGHDEFFKALASKKFKLSPRPKELFTEDTLLNVAPPNGVDLDEIGKAIHSLLALPRYKLER